MPSSVFMTLIEAVPSTIRNSPLVYSEDQPQVDLQQRVAMVAAETTQKILSKDSEPSLHQEVLEESLVLENNSELWMTTTADHSISTSSPRQ